MEVYAGMRAREAPVTEGLLRSFKFYEVSWDIARQAGELKNEWAKKGVTLFLPDITIAALAIAHGLPLLTDNRRDFPMPELQFYPLPASGKSRRHDGSGLHRPSPFQREGLGKPRFSRNSLSKCLSGVTRPATTSARPRLMPSSASSSSTRSSSF